ncbi:ABC transporter permease [Rhodocytophaga aerolata]|uniref:ABC transporter permease n=1 Tax=Rhodocytophaga aerolata TaxID=455078 RepID=A0ABT8RDG0_9BACT|nr:ABC transporter permease [Rhodocytophaga aerolata]MDO1450127.1 ABC transporter permease [Rhodocytophaga aerolata]
MNQDRHKFQPPSWIDKFLQWQLPEDQFEEVQGDMLELYVHWVEEKGERTANWLYFLNAFTFLRPLPKRKPFSKINHYSQANTSHMIANYLKVGFRNLIRQKAYSCINIGGLSIGLACCITIGLYIWDEYKFDRFHTNYRHIYRVVEQQTQAGTLYDVASTPGPLAPSLKTDFAEIQQTCRISEAWWAGNLQTGEKVIEPENILVTDNSFFQVFDFKLIQGNPQKVLLHPDEVVISETLAQKFFRENWMQAGNILGRQIKLKDGRLLTLSGVAENPPLHSQIQFDVLLSCRYDELHSDNYKWQSNDYQTYVLVSQDADVAALKEKLKNYLQKHIKLTNATTLSLQPLSAIYLYSDFDFHTDWGKRGNITYVRVFMAVGTIILLIAVFNFINLSTARAMSRAKEVGVRKAIGALRKQLIVQFLSEASSMTVIAVMLSFLLLQLFLPILNEIAGKSLAVPFTDPAFVFALLGFTLLVSLLAGIYPALYLSHFNPAKVLKGFQSQQSAQFFRQSLVVSQFALSVILITGTIVIYKQLAFMQNKNLGFDKSQLLHVYLPEELRNKASVIKTDLEKLPSIAGVASTSGNLVDVNQSTTHFTWETQPPGASILITHLNIDPDFLTTTGMRLLAGRNFNPAITTDTSSAFIINEIAARQMSWTIEEAIGKKIRFWDVEGTVIGVVNDFHYRPMTTAIAPLLFRYWPKESISGLFVKAKPNGVKETISAIEQVHKRYNVLATLDYQFVDQMLEKQYRTEQNTARIVFYFSILAIMVSCLGLFGLATHTAERRTKEIGVRKILGASVAHIVLLFSSDFLKLVLISFVISSPIAWYALHRWLQDFAYSIRVEWWIFIVTGVLVVTITSLTVSFQAIKAAIANPVKSLRNE